MIQNNLEKMPGKHNSGYYKLFKTKKSPKTGNKLFFAPLLPSEGVKKSHMRETLNRSTCADSRPVQNETKIKERSYNEKFIYTDLYIFIYATG